MSDQNIPQRAWDMLEQGATSSDLVREGILNSRGNPVSSRQASRWCAIFREKREDSKEIPTVPPQIEEEPPHEAVFSENEGGAYASSSTSTIKTLEELLSACQVDLDMWRVDRYEIKTYQGYRRDESKHLIFENGKISGTVDDDGKIRRVTMYAVKAWLIKREERSLENAVQSAIDRLTKAATARKPILRKYSHAEYLLTPDIFDAHMGLIGYAKGSQTLDESVKVFNAAGETLLARAQGLGMGIDQILIVAGNDALHADNLDGTTTKGTRKTMLNNPYDSIEAICGCYTELIDSAVEVAPVLVEVIPGNHDRYSAFWLGMFLAGYYHNHPHVEVNASRDPRKYFMYGSNLIGMGHGDALSPDKLALLMAQEAFEMWGKTRYREFKTGNLHHNRGLFHAIKEEKGVTITTIPALCEPDDYHILNGFVGAHRAAQASFYHKEHGPAGIFPVFVDELPGDAYEGVR